MHTVLRDDQRNPYLIIRSPQNSNTGNLYLGDYTTSQDSNIIQNHNITTVISVLKEKVINYQHTTLIKDHKVIPVNDTIYADLSKYFYEMADWIDEKLTKSNVLVHCILGMSRSVTQIISYLMIKKGYKLNEALEMFKSNTKKHANINIGFMQQLKDLEKVLYFTFQLTT